MSENGGGPGGDGETISDFGRDTYAGVMQLRSEVLQGTYRGRPYKKIAVPKRKSGTRMLTIPAVRDRVLHTSIASALMPIMESMFQDSSFAYRPNRGVAKAVERIEMWHRRGFDVVIEADIVGYFDNIDQARLIARLEEVLAALPSASTVIALVRQVLTEQAVALATPGTGIAQGSPLSPLLANLYLNALDEALETSNIKIVRFADDFVLLCKSECVAKNALIHCARVVEELGLKLHADGTRIVSFDRGFDFIGYLFVRSMAVKADRHELEQPAKSKASPDIGEDGVFVIEEGGSRFDEGKRVLYVLDPAHELSRRNRSFAVLRADGSELIAIPHRRLGRVEIGPGVSYGHNAVELALDVGVELALVDNYGQTRGAVARTALHHGGLHLAQARAINDAPFRVDIAKQLINARIRNQRTQLLRLNRDKQAPEIDGALASMRRNLVSLEHASAVNEVMGFEGASTAAFWPALGQMLKMPATNFRRSRPAADPLNAVINYLTGILERDIRAAIHNVRLHQGFAFLHGTRDNHDGLVYDLIEPFRAPLTEGLAVFLINANRVKSDTFGEIGIEGLVIFSQGRKAIVQGYESAVARRVNVPGKAHKLDWRQMMRWQAQSLVQAVSKSDASLFSPYVMES